MMQSIKEILENGPDISNWTGSAKTRDIIAEQIENRWGKEEVKFYNPMKNALPYVSWVKLGFRPKRGSRSLRSVTFVEQKDALGNIIKKFPRTVCLFYYKQVEPIKNN